MRRIVNFTLGEDQLFEWFHKHALIPNGSSLHGVHYDFESRCFLFSVENGRFAPVPEGAVAPRKRLEYGDTDGPKPL